MTSKRGKRDSPKSLLDASDIILAPVPLRNILLANRNTTPTNPHDRNVIDIILIEIDLETREVSRGPLVESPALHDLRGFHELEVLARDVPAEELELATLLGALEDLGCGAREGRDALRVREGLVELRGGRPELFRVRHRRGVDVAASLALRRGCESCRGSAGSVQFGGRHAAGRPGSGCVLDVLAMLGNQGWAQLGELFA